MRPFLQICQEFDTINTRSAANWIKVANVTSALEYVTLGYTVGAPMRKLLMFSGALQSFDPDYYLQLVELEPMLDASGQICPALVLLEHDNKRWLLVMAQAVKDRPGDIIEHYVFMPGAALPQSALQLQQFFEILPQAPLELDMTVPLLRQPVFSPFNSESRAERLGQLFDALPAPGFESALAMLDALLAERPLALENFPPDFERRLSLIAGLQALLPGELASQLTFASQPPFASQETAQLTFIAEGGKTSARIYDWQAAGSPSEDPRHVYVALLRQLWTGDIAALATDIQSLSPLGQLDALAEAGAELDLAESLQRLTARLRGEAVSNTAISTQAILEFLDNERPPSKILRQHHIRELLQNALNERDAAAGRRVAEELERDADLTATLASVFDRMLAEQPDAVYVFIRNRLMQLGFDESWLPRLQLAARNSLEVVIQAGDIDTVASWLELIAHEPLAYQLHDTLRDGLLSARQRAWNDGALGSQLLLIAARRVPEILDDLYTDEKLMAALDPALRQALISPSAETLDALLEAQTEHFLLAFYHGIQEAKEPFVTSAMLTRLWQIDETDEKVNLPALYRAPALIRLLATQQSQQLTERALDLLLEKILRADNQRLIADMARHLAERDLLFPRLTVALDSERPPLDKALLIMNAVSSLPSAPPRAVIETYFNLLDGYQWAPETQHLVESLARMLAKHPAAQVANRHFEQLFECCQAMKLEGATRVSIERLLGQYGQAEDAQRVAQGLARVGRQIGWSDSLQETLNNWWRDYTYNCSLAQLQRLERELDTQRHLEKPKQILKTLLAMRRWLHNLEPEQLAESINTTFIILEYITEAFDLAHMPELDAPAIRRELDELSGGLASEQRHILANNLRNIAQRITLMAEKRSKRSLIRSDDSIDRQLMHGEANPHGSIDMMKWVAGYLDGAHNPKGN